MFAHVSPESGSTSESVSTLNFAQRVKQVELGKASQNKGTVAEMKTMVRSITDFSVHSGFLKRFAFALHVYMLKQESEP